MKRIGKGRALLLLALAGAILIPDAANAIPAFARRYKVSCTTCHAPIPRLKAYGDEFAGNGFIIPEEEKDRDYVTAGDDLLWLNRDFPIAVRFDAYGVYEDEADVSNDLETPWGVKLLSGGTLYRNIGYYFYFYLSERGEVAGIEDAYLHFNDVGGSALDILVGQFQTSDPLMKRELRLTFEDYQVYKTGIGESVIDLTYDRGVMCLYGIDATGTDLVAMVVNGNGKGESDENGKFDHDENKNAGVRVKQSIGGYGSVGGFVYYGKETFGGEAEEGTDYGDNEVTYWGPDVGFEAGPVAFTGQYLVRKDTHPFFLAGEDEVETEGFVAEIVVNALPSDERLFFTGLYNRVDSDLDEYDYETATVSASYVLARNLRLLAEYTRDVERERNRAVVGFVSAF